MALRHRDTKATTPMPYETLTEVGARRMRELRQEYPAEPQRLPPEKRKPD